MTDKCKRLSAESRSGSGSGYGYGLITGMGATETEPGPAGGPVAGTWPGPSASAVAEAPTADSEQPQSLVAFSQFNAALKASVAVAKGLAATPENAQAPPEVDQIKIALESDTEQGGGLFNVPAEDERDTEKYGGLGIPFNAGKGPVSIVGIVGRGVNPPAPEEGGVMPRGFKDESGFLGLMKRLKRLVTKNEKEPPVAAETPKGAKLPQIYGSSDGEPIGDFETFVSTPAKDIAQTQFDLIKKAVDDGLGDDEEFRLLLVGHSWGADKAIEVMNELVALLGEDGNEALWDLYQQDRIQIHLVTLDAIKQGSALTSDRTPGPGVTPASWLNLKQNDDSGFKGFPPLKGGAFPGANLDNNVPITEALSGLKDKDGTGNGHHAKMPLPEAVRAMIDEHLYPDPDEP